MQANTMLGSAAALATVTIWGAWVVVTRLGVTTTLEPIDVALLRFLVPALVLSPVLVRQGFALRRIGVATTAAMVAGAGAPFFLVSSAGMRFAPAADVGALLPGTMPLFVALLSALVVRERFGAWRLAGFGLIVVGVAAIGGGGVMGGAQGAWRGHALMVVAAALWAGYTLALKRAGIGPWHAAALVSAYSIAGLAPAYLVTGAGRLLEAPGREVALQVLFQGVLSGVVAMAAYGAAVRRLGASRAAAFSALVPVVAALLAIPVLRETPDGVTAAAIAAVAAGVVLASGAWAPARRAAAGPARSRAAAF